MRPIKKTDWDMIAAASPVDKTASLVVSKSKDAPLNVNIPNHIQHWESPPIMTHFPPTSRVGIGAKRGRLTVVGFWKTVKSGRNNKRLVVCRCVCGRFEARVDKSMLKSGPDECLSCRKLHYVQKDEAWLRTSAGKEWSLTRATPLLKGAN